MPVWIFERLVGTDLTTMWRRLRTTDVDVDLAQTSEILSAAAGVREWLVRTPARGSVSGPAGRRERR